MYTSSHSYGMIILVHNYNSHEFDKLDCLWSGVDASSTSCNCWLGSTNTSPLSKKNALLFGEFSISVRNTTGRTWICSLTEASIPVTDWLFLWIIVLCILTSPNALRVLFCQYGLLILLLIKVTASSLGTAFAVDIVQYDLWTSPCSRWALFRADHVIFDQSIQTLVSFSPKNQTEEKKTGGS